MSFASVVPVVLAIGLSLPVRASVVAAESVYADIARQLAGSGAQVTAILKNPATDPHVFEPNPSAARAVAGAAIVIENGIGYDSWMDRLLAASPNKARQVIVVADLLHKHPGDNSHLWYDPLSMPALVDALSAALIRDDPAARNAILARRAALLASLGALDAHIAAMRARFAGADVAATEPVLGPLIEALGLHDRHGRFEISVMNGTDPRASDVASLEDDLRAHRVRVLITNAQATDPEAARLASIARTERIPVVPVSETLPPGTSYQRWIEDELGALQAALSHPAAPQ